MNPLAKQLNQIIEQGNPHIVEMLSEMGEKFFFPKGILDQSAEAKEKAYKLNATIGVALEAGQIMYLNSTRDALGTMSPEESLTYAPSFGIQTLRKAWRDLMLKKNPTLKTRTFSMPVVTSGITHAISTFADLWVDPEDVVVFPDMIWGNYDLIFSIRKCAVIHKYPMFTDDCRFNLAAFAQTLEDLARVNTKLIVFLNFPNNPTGYTLSESEGDAVVEILTRLARQGTNIIAVFDDAYFGLFYEPDTLKESLFSRICQQHPRLMGVKLDGASKEIFAWGLRIGFITYGCTIEGDPSAVYQALEKKTAGCIRSSISNASHMGQSIVLRSIESREFDDEIRRKFTILKSRAEYVKQVSRDSKYQEAWDVYPFNSGYFMCLRLKTVHAETLRQHLLDHYGVGLISMGDKDLRVAFSCLEKDQIPILFEIIFQGIQDLASSARPC